jgi:cytochrome c553
MKSVYYLIFLCLIFNAAGAQSTATTSDPNQQLSAGRLKADQVCANCHGLDGRASGGGNSAMSPSLTAQPRAYLVARLNDYRTGKIEHPQMTLIAKMISVEDIENVALWYSTLKMSVIEIPSEPLLSAQGEVNAEAGAEAATNKRRQVCSSCHGMNGQAALTTSPNIVPHLAGQQKGYLVARLKDYRSGKIQHSLMSPMAQDLSDKEIQLLAEWYSSIRVEVRGAD